MQSWRRIVVLLTWWMLGGSEVNAMQQGVSQPFPYIWLGSMEEKEDGIVEKEYQLIKDKPSNITWLRQYRDKKDTSLNFTFQYYSHGLRERVEFKDLRGEDARKTTTQYFTRKDGLVKVRSRWSKFRDRTREGRDSTYQYKRQDTLIIVENYYNPDDSSGLWKMESATRTRYHIVDGRVRWGIYEEYNPDVNKWDELMLWEVELNSNGSYRRFVISVFSSEPGMYKPQYRVEDIEENKLDGSKIDKYTISESTNGRDWKFLYRVELIRNPKGQIAFEMVYDPSDEEMQLNDPKNWRTQRKTEYEYNERGDYAGYTYSVSKYGKAEWVVYRTEKLTYQYDSKDRIKEVMLEEDEIVNTSCWGPSGKTKRYRIVEY